MLAPTRYITITSGSGVERLTPEQAKIRAVQMQARVHEAKGTLLHERVSLGCFLLQVKDDLRHGEFGPWLATGGVHQKTAERCMRLAARCGDRFGDIDPRKLFALLHAADPEAFPSFAQFDEHRISLRRVEAAIRITTQKPGTAPRSGETRLTVSNMRADRMERMGLVDDVQVVTGSLPRARVGDVAGQGVLVELFRPFAQRLETFATRYDGFDDTKRRRAREIIDRCDRDLAELMGGGEK